MGLFGKKKLTLDEILEGLEALSPEEKEQVKARMNETSSEAPEAVSEPENSETPAVPENIEEAAKLYDRWREYFEKKNIR